MKRLGFITRVSMCAVAGAALFFAGCAQAGEADYQKMDFSVYAGGIHAVKAHMEIDHREKGQYSAVFGAQTRGLVGTLAPWEGSFESRGVVSKAGSYTPKVHESTAMWREEKEVKTYNYGKNGIFKDLVTLYKHKKPKSRVPDTELTEDTTDALSATLSILEHVTRTGKCEGASDVFDGKRRYTLVFKHVKDAVLPESRYNAYSGAAAECIAEVKPIAGAWYKKPRGWLSIQEQGRQKGMMPTVWIAQVQEGARAVPVRVRVKTNYGTMFMHLTRYEGGEIKLASQKAL